MEPDSDSLEMEVRENPKSPIELLFEEMTTFHQDDVAEAVIKWLESPHCGNRAFRKIVDYREN